MNGLVLSLNEVPDGTAESIIDDIDRQLESLRCTATELGLPNASSINWTLISSSTSDGAATQKKFNHLLALRQNEDKIKFGSSQDGLQLVENFCAMHLAVNLREALLEGMSRLSSTEDQERSRDRDQLETFIYEFVKLFGTHGVPEYVWSGGFEVF